MENQPENNVTLLPPEAMHVLRPPTQVLAEAAEAARALKDLIDKKPRKVILNGEIYLEFEDWQTIARFYGISARIAMTRPVRYGDIRGFLARSEAVLISTGAIVSSAEAMCMTDEPKWNMRPQYAKSENGGRRVKIGEEKVPMYQLRSMAQTRACAKALRNVMAWVVVLAGYKATPAEEMQDVFPEDHSQDLPLAKCYECGEGIFEATQIVKTKAEFKVTLCRVCERMAARKKAAQSVTDRKAVYQRQATEGVA